MEPFPESGTTAIRARESTQLFLDAEIIQIVHRSLSDLPIAQDQVTAGAFFVPGASFRRHDDRINRHSHRDKNIQSPEKGRQQFSFSLRTRSVPRM